MADERMTLLLGTVPAGIRRRAFQAAKRANGNLNDEVVGVLAEHYGVTFEPTGRVAPPDSFKAGDRKMLLRVPEDLDHTILRDAVEQRTNKTTLVCSILADHYGLTYRPRSARRSPIGGGRQTVTA